MKPIQTMAQTMPANHHRPVNQADPTASAGKSAQSVGHLAKAAVAQAFSAGEAPPANAQGIAASAIAKGIDPAELFATMVEPSDPPASDGILSDGTEVDPAAADGTGTVTAPEHEVAELPMGIDDNAGMLDLIGDSDEPGPIVPDLVVELPNEIDTTEDDQTP